MKSYLNPITNNPPIRGYLGYAFPLSILFAESEEFMPWLFNHFIQIKMSKNFSEFDFADNDWFFLKEGIFKCSYVSLPKSFFKSKLIIELINEMLGLRYYLTGIYNEKYISYTNKYNTVNYDHDFFIYGHNIEKNIFYTVSYDKSKQFNHHTLASDDFLKSLINIKSEQIVLHFMKINDEFVPSFNYEATSALLNEYYDSKNNIYNYDNNYYFGIDAVKHLIDYLNIIDDHIDVRYFYMLYEHVTLMRQRLKYMHNNGYITLDESHRNLWKTITKETEILLNMCLKFNITTKHNIKKNACEKIRNIVELQTEFFCEIKNS